MLAPLPLEKRRQLHLMLFESAKVFTETLTMGSLFQNAQEDPFLATLKTSSHLWLQPDAYFRAASLHLSKQLLDPLAALTNTSQSYKVQELRKKRKRGQSGLHEGQDQLRLKQVHLEGFGINQVWEQARRVLDASAVEIDRDVAYRRLGSLSDLPPNGVLARSTRQPNGVKPVRFDEERFDTDSLELEDAENGFSKESAEVHGAVYGIGDKDLESDPNSSLDEAHNEAGRLDTDANDEDPLIESDVDTLSSRTFVADKDGLNDGFFSIEEFNRQSEFLEQQDAHGDPDNGAASDEEDIDWAIDPLSVDLGVPPARLRGIPQRWNKDNADGMQDDEALDSGEEDDGPTFGNEDINAEGSIDEVDDVGTDDSIIDVHGLQNTNDIRYDDFFAPPQIKVDRKTYNRPLPKTQPIDTLPRSRPDEDDIKRTMAAVRRDIFEDEAEESVSGSEVPSDIADPLSRRSNHQKRQARLAAEIRRLEAANVAKRDWQLSGEARATDRPLNSLLEEDLDFERAGKPVPMIINEVSEDIESLIKQRILAREFDEVIRRRPDNLITGAGKDVRRGRFELEDTKPKQSLAEIYEAEHLQNVDAEGFVSKSDEKLKAQHEEIEKLWKEVSAKLDALASWHYKPAPPSASINIKTDVPTISMEDARPTAGGEAGGASVLAPQEVYKPGDSVDKKAEVVPKSGAAVRRVEMSKEDKRRRRRREKERIRKAGGAIERADQKAKTTSTIVRSKKAKEQDAVLGQLKKGGVKVIGRKGDLQNMEGQEVTRSKPGKDAGAYKL